jgi:hypothetical protein
VCACVGGFWLAGHCTETLRTVFGMTNATS